MRRVEDVGLAVAEQLKPVTNGYKTMKLSSGKVGKFYSADVCLTNNNCSPQHKMVNFCYANNTGCFPNGPNGQFGNLIGLFRRSKGARFV